METAIVSVHTKADITDSTGHTQHIVTVENYAIRHFNQRTVMLGPASRNVYLFIIGGQIEIISHLIRTPEMALIHKELHSLADCRKKPGLFEMCSFPLKNLMLQTELRFLHKCLSKLYTHIACCNREFICSSVDTFFLDELPASETHHYTSSDRDNLQDEGLVEFCLCILIAAKSDNEVRCPLSLTGQSDTSTGTIEYHMSAGDTCLIYGKSFLSLIPSC